MEELLVAVQYVQEDYYTPSFLFQSAKTLSKIAEAPHLQEVADHNHDHDPDLDHTEDLLQELQLNFEAAEPDVVEDYDIAVH